MFSGMDVVRDGCSMTIAQPLNPAQSPSGSPAVPTPKRFSVDEYHRLTELGFLAAGDRIELIRGELMSMAAKGTPHVFCTTRLGRQLDRLLGDRAVVRCQDPITLAPQSEPEPDLVLALGNEADYRVHHPYPEDILLVVDVADSTVVYDRTVKLSLYAEAEIADYWIVDLTTRRLEHYSDPYQTAQGEFGYRHTQIFLPDQCVTLPSFAEVSVELSQIFPAPISR
jgi:Uma2 family endonuclease